jgi:hypothetical protein
VIRGKPWWRSGSLLTAEARAFRGVLGAKVHVLKPRDPEAKGLLERAHGYLETSFLPGRQFTGPGDFNAQLAEFLTAANRRHRRSLGCAPADRIDADRAAMLPLPPVAPAVGRRSWLRLPRDHYVRVDSNDYSVSPEVIGRRIEVVTDLDRVRAFCDGRPVADHIRVWARHQTITDPAHRDAAIRLRRDRLQLVHPRVEPEVQLRCLADYDTALGVDGIDGGVGPTGTSARTGSTNATARRTPAAWWLNCNVSATPSSLIRRPKRRLDAKSRPRQLGVGPGPLTPARVEVIHGSVNLAEDRFGVRG